MSKSLTQVLLPDLLLTLPIVFLLSLSILVIYSSNPILAAQQAIYASIGIILFYLCSLIDFRYYNRSINLFYLGVLILLIITFIIGFETRGSVRWISLGFFQLQPSELAKPILILVLAKFWSQKDTDWFHIIKSAAIVLPLLLMVFQQPDLGTTLTLGAIWVFSLIGANLSIIKAGLMAALTLPVLYLGSNLLKDYQKDRLLSYLSPTHDPLGTGYNVIQSTIAVGSGQIMGRGLGRGTQSRLQFLPEFRTDFIFASIAEEFGFLGSLIVLGLYGWLLLRCAYVASYMTDRFGVVVIYGVVGMLFFQTVVNLGMNIGVLPVTGITLPLLSYGGSSLIGTLISLGLVASCIRYYKTV
ncbi:rod shape-determining protein RodA [Candidatus Daviesbacteria bacterium RIFCSPLOWO2_02_FULL_40_8]|uniref:Rod shape-determining protein RodA n=1 Tax=Candidatus Daviesbacteria bacterium RIFCSPLOWO2_01_FULL_40_24 TaxID=1797787 RepID=A0A1F5MJ65_9BACT|nr:MAG: rod shape-determining protein RodA [Candidatus Daviesbacteria bacterium RIFCSPHIGHO2_01_FULL_41_45]OGE34481.1 MAG: rod shape-determining protein RodA [Candidatus Daviesbacteria bacterium RIFCSPHIGHO2_02_FULL_41_14]OGE65393.1 MAG: rod shape-determining protein RodA [Candidatus Daviesbacteria bacterium RIFCSPLOWO2_01_FULL_40_24]OGE65908.1 MAG: rod shape-determining protein RodA [Candidatus Daviesbacteria bacterium RIFCSPLOWO2_02_FULL_40_8]